MLTDEELRSAFKRTNTAEPLCEGWHGLERFAREVEKLATLKERERCAEVCDNADQFDEDDPGGSMACLIRG